MLRLDRICASIFIVAFALQLPGETLLTFADELIAAILGMLAVADCLFNRAWKRYTLLWAIMSVVTFYAVYSLTWVHYNSLRAIVVDWIIQLKPFVPFIVFLAVKPVFSKAQLQTLRVIAIINAAASTILLFMPGYVIRATVGHISVPGIVLLLSSVVYALSCGNDYRRGINPYIIVAMLCAGLMCTRSKYYGMFIIALFFFFMYSPGILRRISWRRYALLALLPLLVIIVGWSKFSYYFLTGNSNSYDPEVLESYARPVLYATGALIIADHIPFGSGLASFASWASIDPYSNIYHEYGISKVYGLSPERPWFICDAFYPSLAQFGIIGIILFAWFWIYIISLLKKLIRSNPVRYHLDFACGWSIIFFILIESIASTTFVKTEGMCAMMMLGLICAPALRIHRNEQFNEHSDNQQTNGK